MIETCALPNGDVSCHILCKLPPSQIMIWSFPSVYLAICRCTQPDFLWNGLWTANCLLYHEVFSLKEISQDMPKTLKIFSFDQKDFLQNLSVSYMLGNLWVPSKVYLLRQLMIIPSFIRMCFWWNDWRSYISTEKIQNAWLHSTEECRRNLRLSVSNKNTSIHLQHQVT